MRDPKRIKNFCNELANIWENKCPDWRFGQIISNIFHDYDPFFLEEDEMIKIIKQYFNYKDDENDR